jgi:hypothetical protein
LDAVTVIMGLTLLGSIALGLVALGKRDAKLEAVDDELFEQRKKLATLSYRLSKIDVLDERTKTMAESL